MNFRVVKGNPESQSERFEENIAFLLEYFQMNGYLSLFPPIHGMNYGEKLLERAQNAKSSEDYASLQRDLIALYLLANNGYDFSSIEKDLCAVSKESKSTGVDITDFYLIFQKFKRATESATDISIEDPLLNDAIKSLKTNGMEPPAHEIIDAKEEFARRCQESMNATEI